MSSLRRGADNARRRHREHKSTTVPSSPYDLPDLTGSASSSGSSSSNHSQQRDQQQSTALPKRRQHRRNRHIPHGGRLGHHTTNHTLLGVGGGRGARQRKKSPRNSKQRTSHPAVTSSTPPHMTSSLATAARSKRRTMRRKPSSPTSRSSNADNSILRGAQILREQLLHDEEETGVPPNYRADGGGGLNISLDEEYDYQEALKVRSGMNPSNSILDNRNDRYYENDGEESFSGSDGEWSNPWEISNSKSPPNKNLGRHHDIDEVSGDDVLVDEKSAFSFPTKGDASDWAELSSVEEKQGRAAPSNFKPKEDDQGYDTLLDSQDDQGYDTLLDSSVEFHTRQELPLPKSEAGQPHAQPSDDDTPETFMGRDRALKTKMVTYWVQRADDLEGDSTTLNSSQLADPHKMRQQSDLPMSYLPNDLKREALPKSRKHTRDDDTGYMLGMEASLLPQNEWDELRVNVHENIHPTQHEEVSAATKDSASTQYDQSRVVEVAEGDPNARGMPRRSRDGAHVDSISPLLDASSGETKRFNQLLKDPGFQHAQKAGVLWQSLASQHVRFPDVWFRNGSRDAHRDRRLWHYVGRHRVQDNPVLNFLVGNRGSSGRLLLHLVIRDLMTLAPVQDIAIGCFHPNARGVRWTAEFLPDVEDCRDVWMAFRRRTNECTVAEKLLKPDDANNDGDPEMNDSASPLGGKHAVSNRNMRPVFGEKAPINTIFVEENELYELLSSHALKGSLPPALILLQHYLRP